MIKRINDVQKAYEVLMLIENAIEESSRTAFPEPYEYPWVDCFLYVMT